MAKREANRTNGKSRENDMDQDEAIGS